MTDPNAALPLIDAVRLIELTGQGEVPSVGALRERIRRGSVVGGKDASGRWTVTAFDLAVAGYLPPAAVESQLVGQVPDSPADWFVNYPPSDQNVAEEPSALQAAPADEGVRVRTQGSQRDLYGGEPGTLERLYEHTDDLPFAPPPPSWTADEHAPAATSAGTNDAPPRRTAPRANRRRGTARLPVIGGTVAVVLLAAAAIAASTASSELPITAITPTAIEAVSKAEASLTDMAMNEAASTGDYPTAIQLAQQRGDTAAVKRFRAAQAVKQRAEARAAARKRETERRRAAARRRAIAEKRAAKAVVAAPPLPPAAARVEPAVSAPAAPPRAPRPPLACEFAPC